MWDGASRALPSGRTWSCGYMYEHRVTGMPRILQHLHLHMRLPALPHSIFLCAAAAAAAACHLLAVKHQGIFETHLPRVVRLQPCTRNKSDGSDNRYVTGVRGFIKECTMDGHAGSPVSASKNSSSLFILSDKTHTERRRHYADVMFPPSACPRRAASLYTSPTIKHTRCKNIEKGRHVRTRIDRQQREGGQ